MGTTNVKIKNKHAVDKAGKSCFPPIASQWAETISMTVGVFPVMVDGTDCRESSASVLRNPNNPSSNFSKVRVLFWLAIHRIVDRDEVQVRRLGIASKDHSIQYPYD